MLGQKQTCESIWRLNRIKPPSPRLCWTVATPGDMDGWGTANCGGRRSCRVTLLTTSFTPLTRCFPTCFLGPWTNRSVIFDSNRCEYVGIIREKCFIVVWEFHLFGAGNLSPSSTVLFIISLDLNNFPGSNVWSMEWYFFDVYTQLVHPPDFPRPF